MGNPKTQPPFQMMFKAIPPIQIPLIEQFRTTSQLCLLSIRDIFSTSVNKICPLVQQKTTSWHAVS